MDPSLFQHNRKVISGSAPEDLWSEFAALAAIPRCSKHEAEAREYVTKRADALGLEHATDAAGNLVVRKPASPGFEERPTVVLQAHLDIVCEKNADTEHDFATQGVRFRREGDRLTAEGSTLGADNGIAVAAILAVLSGEYRHGPLEALFTVDEETGLTGARDLDPRLITGKLLINLDSEEEGSFTIGCAGGINTKGYLPVEFQDSGGGGTPIRFAVRGLCGGHSGIEIHKGLGNAISLAARVLAVLSQEHGLALAELRGGEKHNAIPRECFTSGVLTAGRFQDAEQRVGELERALRNEYRAVEPNLRLELKQITDPPTRTVEPGRTAAIARLLRVLPHGVLAMSAEVPELVESSTNLAAVELKESELQILTSQRSSVATRVTEASGRVAAAVELAGGRAETNGGYEPWEPNPDSLLLAKARTLYREREGSEPKIGVIHAGLECGVIGVKCDGMEMLSFGPDIRGAHSPDESVSIRSTERVFAFLTALLEAL